MHFFLRLYILNKAGPHHFTQIFYTGWTSITTAILFHNKVSPLTRLLNVLVCGPQKMPVRTFVDDLHDSTLLISNTVETGKFPLCPAPLFLYSHYISFKDAQWTQSLHRSLFICMSLKTPDGLGGHSIIDPCFLLTGPSIEEVTVLSSQYWTAEAGLCSMQFSVT